MKCLHLSLLINGKTLKRKLNTMFSAHDILADSMAAALMCDKISTVVNTACSRHYGMF